MTKFDSQIFAATIALLLVTGPTAAQEKAPQKNMQERTEKALEDGIEAILKALDEMIDSIPQYEMPEVLDNGDIIIRRKKREEKKKDAPDHDTHRT